MRELVAVGLSPLVGREAELNELDAATRGARLVTVTGPGGVGKTRLALAVLARSGIRSVAVELASVSEPELVVPAATAAIGVKVEPGLDAEDALAANLGSGPGILLLDNCEHVLAAAAELVSHLLVACPALRILATSREPLVLPSEVVFAAQPLSLGASGDAVALFVDRARRASRHFTREPGELVAIARLCDELDGLPLAIELAAARVRTFGVAEIAGELGRRLDMLGGGGGVARHASLRGSLDWSYSLLDEPEQALLARLSVFAGSWDLEAAEAICGGDPILPGQTLNLLAGLVDRSLIVASREHGATRFKMLGIVAEYAREQLAARGELRNASVGHAAWYGKLVADAQRSLVGRGQTAALARLDQETANIRAAVAWGQAYGGHAVTRLATDLALYWHARGRFEEGRLTLQSLRDKASRAPVALRSRFPWALGLMLVARGEFAAAAPVVAEALEWARRTEDPRQIARALNLRAELLLMTAPQKASESLEEAVMLARQVSDDWALADAVAKLGASAIYQGSVGTARPAFEETLAIARRTEDERTMHRALGGLARVAMLEGDPAEGRALLEQGLSISRRVGDRSWIALDLTMLGEHERRLGRLEAASERIAEGLTLAREIRAMYPEYMATGLRGRLALDQGLPQDAAEHFTAAIGLAERAGLRPFRAWWHHGLGAAALSTGSTLAARDHFRSAIAEANLLGNRRDAAAATTALGRVALAGGQVEPAAQQLTLALAIQHEVGDRPGARESLELLLEVFERSGRGDRAAQIADKLAGDGLEAAATLALRGRGHRVAAATDGWAGLTRAEAEVADLAAAGVSNPEIAERLFMSRSTVKAHLSRAYAKLGVANRTELAAVDRGAR